MKVKRITVNYIEDGKGQKESFLFEKLFPEEQEAFQAFASLYFKQKNFEKEIVLKSFEPKEKVLAELPERFDVMCPVYWTNRYFEQNIEKWFEEIPVKTLYLGLGRKELEISSENPNIKLVDQTHHATLGACLAELMRKMTTDWFVYLHADAEPMRGSFASLCHNADVNVGIVESERLKWDGTMLNGEPHFSPYTNYYKALRAYSGFQLIRKDAVASILDKIEDDYVYRNEDIVFQSECLKNGYEYRKSCAMHVHQVFDPKWSFDYEQAHVMQVKGLVKYTEPNEVNKKALVDPLLWCRDNVRTFTLPRLLMFCYQYNPNWCEIIIEAWNNG